MGRGRQKAKQTKVARKLKYYSPETDYRALEHELAAGRGSVATDEYRNVYVEQTDEDDGHSWEEESEK